MELEILFCGVEKGEVWLMQTSWEAQHFFLWYSHLRCAMRFLTHDIFFAHDNWARELFYSECHCTLFVETWNCAEDCVLFVYDNKKNESRSFCVCVLFDRLPNAIQLLINRSKRAKDRRGVIVQLKTGDFGSFLQPKCEIHFSLTHNCVGPPMYDVQSILWIFRYHSQLCWSSYDVQSIL